MSFYTLYNYNEKSTFGVKNILESIRFIIINFILAIIFLFLALEEIDWAIFSFREKINAKIIDNTSWNIRKIF